MEKQFRNGKPKWLVYDEIFQPIGNLRNAFSSLVGKTLENCIIPSTGEDWGKGILMHNWQESKYCGSTLNFDSLESGGAPYTANKQYYDTSWMSYSLTQC